MNLNRVKRFICCLLCTIASALVLSAHAHTLSQVVQHTVKTNPDVLRTAKIKHATNEQVKQARADYFPRVDVRAGLGRERTTNNNTKAVSGDSLSLWRRGYGVSLRQNLFRGFQTHYEVKRTKAKTDADAYAVCAAAEDIALDATESYINVLRYQHQESVAQKNLAAHRKIHDMIRQRGESGIGREADVSQATGRLALAKSNWYNIDNNYNNATVTFSRVTGLKAHNLMMPADPAQSVLPRSLTQAEYMALRFHPKMRIAVVDVEELRAQHNVSHYTAFPQLDLVLEANRDLNVNGSKGRNDAYYAGLELNYNLFRGGADVARQRETAYLTQEAAEVRNRTCREVKENVRLAWNNLQTAHRRLVVLEQHKNSAIQTRNAYNEQFRLGKRTLFDLLDAQNEQFTSELDYVNGIYDIYIAEYRVLNAIGGLNSYLRVNIPEAAHAQYDIYSEAANPINVKRHFDARLWEKDYPAKWYHGEKVHHECLGRCKNCTHYKLTHCRPPAKLACENHPHKKACGQQHCGRCCGSGKHRMHVASRGYQGRQITRVPYMPQASNNPRAERQPFEKIFSFAGISQRSNIARNRPYTPVEASTTSQPIASQRVAKTDPITSSSTQAAISSPKMASSQPTLSNQAPTAIASKQFIESQFTRDSTRTIEKSPLTISPIAIATTPTTGTTASNVVAINRLNTTTLVSRPQRAATPVKSTQKAQQPYAKPRTGLDHSIASRSTRTSTVLTRSPSVKPPQQVATSTIEPKSLSGWAIEVGRFTQQQQVASLTTKLKNDGMNGFVKEIRTPTDVTYEVYVGPLKKQSEAKQLIATLSGLNIKGIVVRMD